jgi:hypothetical protein
MRLNTNPQANYSRGAGKTECNHGATEDTGGHGKNEPQMNADRFLPTKGTKEHDEGNSV